MSAPNLPSWFVLLVLGLIAVILWLMADDLIELRDGIRKLLLVEPCACQVEQPEPPVAPVIRGRVR